MTRQFTKKYADISCSTRAQFIKLVESKQTTIKEAASRFGIKFSTSKAILQIYRKEGRIGKKTTRSRGKCIGPPGEEQGTPQILTDNQLQANENFKYQPILDASGPSIQSWIQYFQYFQYFQYLQYWQYISNIYPPKLEEKMTIDTQQEL